MLKTNRIELIPLGQNDLDFFIKINHDPVVRKFLWDDVIMPVDTLEQVLRDVELRFANDNWGLWKIRSKTENADVGYVGLWLFFDEHQPQLIYALSPEHTGMGYATEGSKLVIDHAFQKLKFPHLVATMDKANIDSVKVCERLGFRFLNEQAVESKPVLFYRLTGM